MAHHLSPHGITEVTVQMTPSHRGNNQQLEQGKALTQVAVFFHRESSQLPKK